MKTIPRRKRIEHKTKEDSKEPVMEETYITLTFKNRASYI
jgi:hypothetical protein